MISPDDLAELRKWAEGRYDYDLADPQAAVRRLLDEVEALRAVFSSPGFVLDHAGKREVGWPIEEVEQALGITFDVNIGGES